MKSIRNFISHEISYLLSFPAIFWQLFFLYLPLTILILYSVVDYNVGGIFGLTFQYYRQLLTSEYLRVILNSLEMASITTFFCFSIAYPVAYFLAFKVPARFRTALLFSLLVPSWTSLIVQIYAWLFILDKNGFFSKVLYFFHILSPETYLLNSPVSVLICMVSIYLPFMILPLYTNLEKMDKRLLEASADLGSTRWQSFRYVVFPQSYSGIVTGIVLVFLPAFGEFATPMLLGGRKKIFWGNVVVEKFLMSRDWRQGAALALIGISFSLLALLLLLLVSRARSIVKKIIRKKRGMLSWKI
jgi:spermidine/putrescine transport system permease protein